MEEFDGSNELKLKSKLLNNFVTLDEFVSNVRQERFMDLVYEKFASEDGKKELIKHSTYYFYNVEQFKKSIESFKEEVKKQEEFFDIITKQLSGIEKNILLKDLPIFGDILIQMFEKFKDRKELIGKLFYSPEITFSAKYKYDMLLSKLNKLYNEQNETLVKMMGPIIKTMVKSETSFKNITKRLDEKELSKELIAEIIEEIQSRKYVEKQLVNYVSQTVNREVQGIEKLITAMLLLGYKDISGTNMGIMKLIYNNRDGDEITENVYAKVDMSDSFHNLQYKDHSRYINDLKHIIKSSLMYCNVIHDIDYDKLKEEIDKACNFFINNPQHTISLIHKALFYTKPLLKTQEELNLVENLAEKIKIQAKLLKEFASSQEFKILKEDIVECDYDDYIENRIFYALESNEEIFGKHPITYALERQEQIQDKEPLDWIKENRNHISVKDWLTEHVIENLDDFQTHNELVQKLKIAKTKSIIKKITDSVEANLAQNSEHSKTIENPRINSIENDMQKTR